MIWLESQKWLDALKILTFKNKLKQFFDTLLRGLLVNMTQERQNKIFFEISTYKIISKFRKYTVIEILIVTPA